MYHSIELVDPILHPNLYLKLVIMILKASNPEQPEQFGMAFKKTAIIFEIDFLNSKGKNYATKVQQVARHFA